MSQPENMQQARFCTIWAELHFLAQTDILIKLKCTQSNHNQFSVKFTEISFLEYPLWTNFRRKRKRCMSSCVYKLIIEVLHGKPFH